MNKLPVIVKAFLLFIAVWGLLVGVLWLNIQVVNWLPSQGMPEDAATFWIIVIVFLAFYAGITYFVHKTPPDER